MYFKQKAEGSREESLRAAVDLRGTGGSKDRVTHSVWLERKKAEGT